MLWVGAFGVTSANSFRKGGNDETRTRDLCRDGQQRRDGLVSLSSAPEEQPCYCRAGYKNRLRDLPAK